MKYSMVPFHEFEEIENHWESLQRIKVYRKLLGLETITKSETYNKISNSISFRIFKYLEIFKIT